MIGNTGRNNEVIKIMADIIKLDLVSSMRSYLTFNYNNIITKCEWQRYTSSRLFLGSLIGLRSNLLADAKSNNW